MRKIHRVRLSIFYLNKATEFGAGAWCMVNVFKSKIHTLRSQWAMNFDADFFIIYFWTTFFFNYNLSIWIYFKEKTNVLLPQWNVVKLYSSYLLFTKCFRENSLCPSSTVPLMKQITDFDTKIWLIGLSVVLLIFVYHFLSF